MDYEKWLLWLIKISLALTLVVIILGAYTRISDAGLGCPDWPGCYGQMVVPSHSEDIIRATQHFPEHTIEPNKAWLEMIHRYVAGTLGLFIVALAFVSMKVSHVSKRLPLALVLVVFFQAALGMWTVTLKLMPIIVVLHLFGGFFLLSLLFIFYLSLRCPFTPSHNYFHSVELPTHCVNSKLSLAKGANLYKETNLYTGPKLYKGTNLYKGPNLYTGCWLVLMILSAQIFLGGWTSSNYAALVCTRLPLCDGNWWQAWNLPGAFTIFQHSLLMENGSFEYGVLDYGSRMTIHILHRMGAVCTALAIVIFAWRLWRSHVHPRLNYAAGTLVGLLAIQIGLGVSNIVLHLPVILAVLHNFVAALLLLNTVLILVGLKQCFAADN
ncbi:COX15/CtaA family protein [Vibrio aphrogenes]|uniref:COX15/CtaA family protein n=1 Tax=Vibrio aphrogenes TaxID=1891186 RepID=UPI000B35ADBF|nr:COX15/CtaA family protein [Vibrio aphrogenes]